MGRSQLTRYPMILIPSGCLCVFVLLYYSGLSPDYLALSYISRASPPRFESLVVPKPPRYLGCFTLSEKSQRLRTDGSKREMTAEECVSICTKTGPSHHMYSYFKSKTKECSCDDLFIGKGMKVLDCNLTENTAEVYVSDKVHQIKYNVLSRNWRNASCGCAGSDCTELNCHIYEPKDVCWLGPDRIKLRIKQPNDTCRVEMRKEQQRLTAGARAAMVSDTVYCIESMLGFLPADCQGWPKVLKESTAISRLYKISSNVTEVRVPLKSPLDQIKVLLLTRTKGGSNFLSEFFKGHPSSHYMYDVLYESQSESTEKLQGLVNNHSVPSMSIELLDRVFRCDFDNIPLSVIEKVEQNVNHLFTDCGSSNRLSRFSCVQAHYSNCLSSDMLAIETRHAKLSWARKLLQNFHPGLKVVYLVRDPRAVINSRTLAELVRNDSDHVAQAKDYCESIIENFHVAQSLRNSRFRSQLIVLRYEDIVDDNLETLNYIYKSLYLGKIHDSLISHVNKVGDETPQYMNIFNEERVSSFKRRLHSWKYKLSYEKVQDIDEVCGDAYKLAGYLPVKSPAALRNKAKFHILGKHSLS